MKEKNNNNNVFAELNDIIDKLYAKIVNYAYEPTSLEKFASLYNKSIDDYILKKENEFDQKFISGSLKLYYINKQFFGLVILLYFQDKNKEFIKKKYKKEGLNVLRLNQKAFTELKEKQTIQFEINKPEEIINKADI